MTSKDIGLADMPDGTHLIKYQEKQYQAFWQDYRKGIRLFADSRTAEGALKLLNRQLTELSNNQTKDKT